LKRFNKKMLAAAAAAMLASQLLAADFKLRDIRVEGLQRTEPGTVFSYLPFKVGDDYTDDKGAQAIRALYATGIFKDVRIEIDGDVVVVIVEERPVIAELNFSGIKEFDKDALQKSLKEVGLGEGRPFDRSIADRAEQELKRQYLSKGLYAAEVTTTVTPIERNRVNLTFSVVEGKAAKIRDIRVVGARAFSESELISQFDLTTPGWLTWYTKTDQYSRSKLNADLEILRAYYLNRGYLEFRIDSTQVAISPSKEDISITINITEGEKYTIAGFSLEGEYHGKNKEFEQLVQFKPGDVYNGLVVNSTVRRFQDKFGGYGFAFARVEPQPQIDRDKKQATIVFVADPGRRAYVRRINISGNTRTRDEVIRREFRQFEGAWYDAEKIKTSRERVDRLGFFKDVNIETIEVPGTPDQVDIALTVTEKPTGAINFGAGYSSTEKLSLSGSFKQENAFGSGDTLGIEINTSSYSKTYAISTFKPYYTIDGISRALDIYYRTTTPLDVAGSDYVIRTPGARVQFGVPFSENDTVYFGAGVERTTLILGSTAPLVYQSYVAQFGESTNSIALTAGWGRDTRDSALVPNSGRFMKVLAELSPVADVRYARIGAQYQEYIPLGRKLTFAFNTEVGYGKGLGGRPYPIFKYYTGGGLGSVRGYETGSLGPRYNDTYNVDLVIGGTKKFNANFELLFPVPGSGNDRTLRLFSFFDMGNVYGDKERFSFSNLKYSAGFGINWVSPVGPLRLSLGYPLRRKPEDKVQRVQFQVGTSF
jgi:outer membrane protein insertion porin family